MGMDRNRFYLALIACVFLFSVKAHSEYPFSAPFGFAGGVDKRQALGVIVGKGGKIAASIKPALDQWFLVNSPFEGDDVHDVVWDANNGLWIAVGDKGKIATSENGIKWILRTSGTGQDLLAVDSYGDLNVAVGDNGTVVVSTNAVDWIMGSTPPGSDDLHDVSNHTGVWIAGGYDGKLYYSTQPQLAGFWTAWNSNFGGKDVNAVTATTVFNMSNGLAYLRRYYIVGDDGKVAISQSLGASFVVSAPFAGKVFGVGTDEGTAYAVGASGQGRSNASGAWSSFSTYFGSSDVNNITRREPFLMVGQEGKVSNLYGPILSPQNPFGLSELTAIAQKSDQNCLAIDNVTGGAHGALLDMTCPTNLNVLKVCEDIPGQCNNRKSIRGTIWCSSDPNFVCP